MIDLPFDPDSLPETSLLAQYLAADRNRFPVLLQILDLLDDDGSVGDDARYYIIQTSYRRAVLRGVLIAEGIPLPNWAHDNHKAMRANNRFAASYAVQALHDQPMLRRRAAS